MERIRPDYDGACVMNVARELLGGRTAEWLPPEVKGARAIVLLVLDGLGWELLEPARSRLPALGSLNGGPITTVFPSTTPVALTSMTTGLPPAEHGIVGYRIRLPQGVFNAVRWSIHGRREPPPDPVELQPRDAFAGRSVPAVSRAGFEGTGLTDAHLRGTKWSPWHTTSGIVEWCRWWMKQGERFVWAYYDGPDLVAHIHGLDGPFYSAELEFCDRLVADVRSAMPGDAALVVTADHGHVPVGERLSLKPLHKMVETYAQEARCRYLYARQGAGPDLAAAARELFGTKAWVFERDQLIEEGWLGPRPPSPTVARRIGDVVLTATGPWGFDDPTNQGEGKLLTGHGGITSGEMLVPLLAGLGTGG